MAINEEWHRSQRVLPEATREQRVAWQAAHAAACGCEILWIPLGIRPDVLKLLKSCRKP